MTPKIAVVTKVADPDTIGNLALPPFVRFQTEEPSVSNGFNGKTQPAAAILGGMFLSLRAPVFTLGEILIMIGDRDVLGRAPGKWDVTVTEADDLETAVRLSEAVQVTK